MRGDFIIIGGRRTEKSTQLINYTVRSMRNLGEGTAWVISPSGIMSDYLLREVTYSDSCVLSNSLDRCAYIHHQGVEYRLYFFSLDYYLSMERGRQLTEKIPCYFDEMDSALRRALPGFTGGAMTYPLIKLENPWEKEDEEKLKKELSEDQYLREFQIDFRDKE